MKKRFREHTQEVKTACRIDEHASDEAWLYCDKCHRAMVQGDCVVDDSEPVLRCAYADCDLGGDLAYRSLHGWEDYRRTHALETAHWPTDPVLGSRYV
jgi:hypothetical protein